MNSTLIVAIGNTVMGDDGVAHHVINTLRNKRIAADTADLGTDISRMRLHLKKGHRKIIIIDSLIMDAEPGTIITTDLNRFEDVELEGTIRHAHFMGMVEIIKILRLIDKNVAEKDILFFGIVAERIEKGLTLSSKMEKAVPLAVKKISALL